jgi:hypothetical protein
VTDDTRDVALTARESAKSAHHRLDGINGQIGGLRTSHEKMREDFNAALYDPDKGLHPELVALRTTVHSALKVAAVIVSAVLAVCTGLTVYAVTHLRSASPSRAPQAQTEAQAASAQHAQVWSRQRGSSGR